MELDAAYARLGKIYVPVNYRRTIELLDKGPQKIAPIAKHLGMTIGSTYKLIDILKAANAKMRKCLEAIAEHHWERGKWFGGSEYHTERRDFAREGLK